MTATQNLKVAEQSLENASDEDLLVKTNDVSLKLLKAVEKCKVLALSGLQLYECDILKY